jgi:hypothetical protein
MTQRAFRPAALLLALLLVTPALAAQDALRYRWTEGETVRYRTTTDTNTTMDGLPGIGSMTVTNTMVQTYAMTVDKVAPDGTATIRVLFEAIKMDIASPMMNASYDSATGAVTGQAPGEMAEAFGAMVGKSVTMTMAPDGSVQKVEGGDAIGKALESTSAGAAAMGVLGGALGSMMGDEALKGSFAAIFGRVADATGTSGDTWSSEITMPNPAGTQTIATRFTRQGVERAEGRDLLKIGIAQTIKTAGTGKASGPFTITAGDATGTGDMLFDPKSGRLERSNLTSTMPMTMSMAGPDGSPLNLSSQVSSRTTVELVKK